MKPFINQEVGLLYSIRTKLTLTYAGLALLVAVLLGSVLYFSLRSYYRELEISYLQDYAFAFNDSYLTLLNDETSPKIRDAQVQNLAFMGRCRVRLLDDAQQVIADSGSWQYAEVTLMAVEGEPPRDILTAPSSTENRVASGIILQRLLPADTVYISTISSSEEGKVVSNTYDLVYEMPVVAISGDAFGFAFNSDIKYFALNRSDAVLLLSIYNATDHPIGYIELSEGPAYGQEVLGSVMRSFAVAAAVTLALAMAAGWWVSRRFSTPLVNLAKATAQMTEGNLSVRVTEPTSRDELGTLARTFNRMAERIESTVFTLKRFAADAAHEMQTPVTALRTYLEMAQTTPADPAQHDYIQRAHHQVLRLQQMTAGLLDLSRLENSQEMGNFQPVDAGALLQEVSERFAARAEQAGSSFHLNLPEKLPEIPCNRLHLQRALENLLDNALKFTPALGSITLEACEKEQHLFISVEDTGIGIPPEDLEHLFSRFHRGRNAAAYSGCGLGLAIVRAIVQAHNGQVRVKNLPGGTRFEMEIPVA